MVCKYKPNQTRINRRDFEVRTEVIGQSPVHSTRNRAARILKYNNRSANFGGVKCYI